MKTNDDFAIFLEKASEEVSKWPEWKRNILGEIKRMRTVKKSVPLFLAAYFMINGYKFVTKEGDKVYFEVDEDKQEDFDSLVGKYFRSDFHRYDACVESLKKL